MKLAYFCYFWLFYLPNGCLLEERNTMLKNLGDSESCKVANPGWHLSTRSHGGVHSTSLWHNPIPEIRRALKTQCQILGKLLIIPNLGNPRISGKIKTKIPDISIEITSNSQNFRPKNYPKLAQIPTRSDSGVPASSGFTNFAGP